MNPIPSEIQSPGWRKKSLIATNMGVVMPYNEMNGYNKGQRVSTR